MRTLRDMGANVVDAACVSPGAGGATGRARAFGTRVVVARLRRLLSEGTARQSQRGNCRSNRGKT